MNSLTNQDIKRFQELLDENLVFKAEDDKVLNEIVQRYPFFNEARILQIAWKKHFDTANFAASIPETSLYAGNRLLLKLLIDKSCIEKSHRHPLETKVPSTEASVAKSPIIKEETKEKVVSPPLMDEERKMELEAQVEERLKAISEAKKETEKSLIQALPVDPNELIEKFLKEDPRIKPVKEYFASEYEESDKSLIDEGGLVSETLARIHSNQGNYRKAMEIYNKLSLKFPGKSSYFAARIKELQEKLSE